MAKVQRRTQDLVQTIVNNNSAAYTEALNTYQDYINGSSPLTIYYYQINDEASRTDTSLEATREVVGSQSSLYYNRIKNVQIYCQNYQDIVVQATQRGREAFITGDFIITPDLNINPKSSEFICFIDPTYPEISEHLFQITDVQFDRASSQKYYKCSFKLYPKDKDNIDPNRVVGKYIYKKNGPGNTAGVGDSVLITEEANETLEQIENLTQYLVDEFKGTYYNSAMDTFTYQRCLNEDGTEFEYYWNPYLIHFIYKNDILSKYNRDFMEEIYINDITESDYPRIYSERGYRKSLLYSIETKDMGTMEPIDSTLIETSAYDLSMPLNLPFFSSAEKYNLLEVNYPTNRYFWFSEFNWVKQDETKLIPQLDPIFRDWKVGEAILDYLVRKDLYDSETGEISDVVYDQVFYQLDDSYKINNMMYFPKPSNNAETITPYRCDILSLINRSEEDSDLLIEIIKKYFNNTLVLDEDTIDDLLDYYYENSIKNYILMPIIIYILLEY